MNTIVIPESFDIQLVNGNLKAAMKRAGAGSSDLWHVPRPFINVLPGFNVRLVADPGYQLHIEALANSIEQSGFAKDKPLTGFVAREDGEDLIYVTDGHSRLAAVDQLLSRGCEIGPIPMVIKPRGTSLEDLTFELAQTAVSRTLTPFELAILCKRAMIQGVEEKIIAKRLNISTRYVQDLMHLVGAPIKIRQMVISAQLSATAAIEALKEHGNKAEAVLLLGLDHATKAGKTRVTQKHIKAAVPKTEAPQSKPGEAHEAMLADVASAIEAWDHADDQTRGAVRSVFKILGFHLDALSFSVRRAGGI